MAHFAIIDKKTSIVEQVIVVQNENIIENGVESETKGVQFVKELLRLANSKEVVQTSYSGSFRHNFAGIGFSFDFEQQAFIAPKPAALPEEIIEEPGDFVLNKNFQWEYTGKIKSDILN